VAPPVRRSGAVHLTRTSDDWQRLRELKELIAWARHRGATTMTLSVIEGNEPARRQPQGLPLMIRAGAPGPDPLVQGVDGKHDES
jgi:hypothetical protein